MIGRRWRVLPGRLLHDVRAAGRGLQRRPGYAVTVILTLALGIGAVSAVFSLVDAVLLEPLDYPDSGRLVGLWFTIPDLVGPDRARQSEATYLHIQRQNETFESVALSRERSVTLDDGVRPERLEAALVTPTMFQVLRVQPALGRPLGPEDGLPGAEPVVVLGHDLWRGRFGGDEGILGSTIEVDGVRRRVVGVLPAGLRFPEGRPRLWLPHRIDPAQPVAMRFFHTGWARLREGATPEAAVRDMERMIRTLPDAYPMFPRRLIESGRIRALVVPLREDLVGGVERTLWIVLGAVSVVLLIAAANVANLLLTRAESRHPELVVRSALGAGRGRLAAHLLVESTILALLGGGLGLVLAGGALRAFVRAAPDVIPRLDEVGVDLSVVGFTLAVALGAGLLVGLQPALRASRASIADALRSGSRSLGAGRVGMRLRAVQVAGQVALALVVLAAAGLLLRSYWALRQVRPGFEAKSVLGARISLPDEKYPDWERAAPFFQRLVEQVRSLPGVEAAGATTFLPLRDGRVYYTWELQDHPRGPDDLPLNFLTKLVTDGYFETMGIPLVEGRTLERADWERGTDAVLVNATMAERYWPGKSPVGRRIRPEGTEGWYTIVGVVGGVRDRRLDAPPEGMVYLPMLGPPGGLRFTDRAMSLAIRGAAPASLAPAVRAAVRELDAGLPVYDVRSMSRVVADAAARPRLVSALLLGAALAALVLAAVGLYGLLSYLVVHRRRDLALRMVLGAEASQVRRLVVRQALLLAGAGIAAGTVVSLGAARVLGAVAYGVKPADPLTLIAVAALLMGVALLAGDLPARRAARLEPGRVLQEEG